MKRRVSPTSAARPDAPRCARPEGPGGIPLEPPERVRLEKPSIRRCAEFLASVRRSRRLHGQWIAAPSTREQFVSFLARTRRPTKLGWFVVAPSGELAGVINASEIVRGNFLSAYLGYYALAPHQRRGYMTEGLRLAMQEAFDTHGLHRLEANIQPGNTASRRLVRRLGFRREGFSPRYLEIAGRWRDHQRWAITREEWTGESRARRKPL